MDFPNNIILAAALREKAERRRRFAAATFAEKIAIVEKLREELLPLKAARFMRPDEAAAESHADLR